VLALFLMGALYAALSPATQVAADTGMSAQVAEGKALFQVTCSSCHGLNGEGTTQGPSLVGVGAAVALVGAITGTLVPQAIGGGENAAIAGIVAVLTVLTLLYFQFTGRQNADGVVVLPGWQRLLAGGGRLVLTIAFAALFAGLLTTSLGLLVERVRFYLSWALDLTGGSLP